MFIGSEIIKEIEGRLGFLDSVGLDYLTLDRKANTLSGGESQRIRLATQIGSRLTGVMYVLDEPSIGLHQRDNDRLLKTLRTQRPWQHLAWWWNTMKTHCVRRIGFATSGRERALKAAWWWPTAPPMR